MEFFGELVDTSQSEAQQRLLPRIERRTTPKFMLMIHPDRWSWDDEASEWLPEFGRLKLDPGVGGVGLKLDGKTVEAGPAISHRTEQGWIIIRNGSPQLADVLPGGQYLKAINARGGKAYTAVWELAYEVNGEVEWETDAGLLRKIRQHLKAEVLNGEPPVRWKRAQVRLQRRRVQRLHERHAGRPEHPTIKSMLTLESERLEAWEADLAKQEDGAPKGKSKSKSKKPAKREPMKGETVAPDAGEAA